MYQNMDCAILGYDLLTYATSYKVLNSAGEQILEPVTLEANTVNYGILIPYGGYLEITMDESHRINFKSPDGSISLFTAGNNAFAKFKVVRDYNAIVSKVNNENGVETYTELHP